MRKHRLLTAACLSYLISSLSANADGLIANGHVNGAHTLLMLTKEQKVALTHSKKITLTDSQRKTLAGLKNAATVKELTVYPVTEETCTCELKNVAVRINDSTIEVSNNLFGRDFAEEERLTREAIRKNEEQEKKRIEIEQSNNGNLLNKIEKRTRIFINNLIKQLQHTDVTITNQ